MAKVMGFKELQAKMHSVTAEVAGKISRRAVAAAAKFVKEEARRLRTPIAKAPYIASGYERDLTLDKVEVNPGNVGKHIIIKRRTRTEYSAHYIVTLRGKKKYGYAKRIGALIEHGTVNQSANPFLGPALSNNLEEVKKIMAKRMQSGLKKAGAL